MPGRVHRNIFRVMRLFGIAFCFGALFFKNGRRAPAGNNRPTLLCEIVSAADIVLCL